MAIIVVGFCVVNGFIHNEAVSTPQGRESYYCDDQHAGSEAKEFVTRSLKAPSTASFGSNQKFTRSGCQYTVTGFVDAQNGFGAQIRSTYLVELHYEADRNVWHADNVALF